MEVRVLRRETGACSLVEGDVHPPAVPVEREVGVAEQLPVAFPEGERRRRGEKPLAHGSGGEARGRRQEDAHDGEERALHWPRSPRVPLLCAHSLRAPPRSLFLALPVSLSVYL
uniref:Uncharacterized protein n=1 Tax=Arundo donax TaxID=35708 RepID=A0A0A9E7V9_ARUDO